MNKPQPPFEDAELHFFGGERAPLATPGALRRLHHERDVHAVVRKRTEPCHLDVRYHLAARLSSGSPCPGASLPFSPSLTVARRTSTRARSRRSRDDDSRQDGEQNLQSVEAHLPPGLSGILSNVELCPEPQANEGTCGPNSLIGETTVCVGVGGEPFTVTGGKFYLTGPYNGSGGCTVGKQVARRSGSRSRSRRRPARSISRKRSPTIPRATACSCAARSKSTRSPRR